MLAYIDCFAGISGDMTLGALVDLGLPLEKLEAELRRLPLSGFTLKAERTSRKGIACCRVEVRTDEHGHQHRNFAHIRRLIEASPLAEGVKGRALSMFTALAEAEAGIHGCARDEVHFHEVGGVDAIVDIVGAALGLEHLGIHTVVVAPIPTGSGFVDCQHGRLPVPAPATLALLKGVPVYGSDIEMEMTTPTGAAIATTLATSYGALPSMCVQGIGYGAGTRELSDRPNLLRIVLGEPPAAAQSLDETVSILETVIDDMNPEFYGYLMEKLFEDGALDVGWVPVHSKKNRPGNLVQVLCRPEGREGLLQRILAETTTGGVRYGDVRRRILPREAVRVQTVYGEVTAKRFTGADGTRRLAPEYEICRTIAQARGLPLRDVYAAVLGGTPLEPGADDRKGP